MGKLVVSVSPLSNRIIAGSLLKNGYTYGANKTDVTEEAVASVAVHLQKTKQTFEFTLKDGKTYQLKVEEVRK